MGNVHSLRREIAEYIPLAMSNLYTKDRRLAEMRNTLITMSTMAYMEAVSAGLPTKAGLQKLAQYHGLAERCTDFSAISKVIEEILLTFCKMVSSLRYHSMSSSVRYCVEYVKKHLHEKITLAMLAQHLFLHPSYLSTLFKTECGRTFSEFLITTKIEEAKKLLSYTNSPFSEIAIQLFFSDQSHFARTFKKHVGITPREYRKGTRL